jgi:hypothetical protein
MIRSEALLRQIMETTLPDWVESFNSLDALYLDMKFMFELSPECRFNTFLFKGFENYTRSLQQIIDTNCLDWYCWDNDMGKNGHSIFIDDKEYPISSIEDLIEAIIVYKKFSNEIDV